MSFLKHPQSLCEAVNVGIGTKISAFACVLADAQIGNNCIIGEYVFIGNDVQINNNVIVGNGAQLSNQIQIADNVFIGKNVVFENEKYLKYQGNFKKHDNIVIENNVVIGANVTIVGKIHIGRYSVINPGAVIFHDIPPYARVAGNPAIIIGYENQSELEKIDNNIELSSSNKIRQNLNINGCFIERLPYFADMRGELVPLEIEKGLPFKPERVFLVYGVSGHHVRGEHAHKRCEQFLVAAHGSISVVVDDGEARKEVLLDSPNMGLYLAPMTWGIQYKFSLDAVLMVLASQPYIEDDYIRDYNEFLSLLK